MNEKIRKRYRKKPITSLVGKKYSEIDPAIASHLQQLERELFAINIDDIQAGKVTDKILRIICGEICNKMKELSEFKNLEGLYVIQALAEICNGVKAEKAFRLGKKIKTTKTSNPELNIAYAVWQENKFSKDKQETIFSKAAQKYNKTVASIRKIYFDHKIQIDNLHKSTEINSL